MSSERKTIWLLSAYRSESHATWADWLIENFPDYHWQRLELPGRHFRWRIRGNPLSWLDQLPTEPADLMIATSMVDLATLKGIHPRLANIPSLYYFHENQFAYPLSGTQHASIDPQMVQLYGALAANRVVFNSDYNRKSFLQGVDALLNKLPDHVPGQLAERIAAKSRLLAVPVKSFTNTEQKNSQLVLWNHRWEYDKAPEVFYEALKQLGSMTDQFQLALLGDRSASSPKILQCIEADFSAHIVVNEKVSIEEYKQWLALSKCVVSCARHEFQGLSVIQAVSAGAVPIVPDDVCYPEQYGAEYLYPAGDAQTLAEMIYRALTQAVPVPDMSNWNEAKLKPAWQALIDSSLK